MLRHDWKIHARIESTALPDGTWVRTVEGREVISELFDYAIAVVVPEAALPMSHDGVIGARADLIFEAVGSAEQRPVELRRIHGMLASCADALAHDAVVGELILRLVPRLWLATLVETLDIFQDLTYPQIIEKKLALLGLRSGIDVDMKTMASPPTREFTVQYKESDLGFIKRLTEHIGMSFVFDHRDGSDHAVFVDDKQLFPSLDTKLVGVPFPLTPEDEPFDLRWQSQVVPSNFVQRDYNYRNPASDLLASASFDGFGGGIVEYGGHFRSEQEGAALASTRAEEKRWQAATGTATCADPRMSAGFRCPAPEGAGTAELLVYDVHLRYGAGGGVDAHFTSTFRAIDASVTYRPPRTTPKPRVHGLLNGIIESATGKEYADLDDEGRYRVRFMFDTSEAGTAKASRPVRMMQPHTGPGYGMHFPLRAGAEVLIAFIDGDPDRPIICGAVPNPQTASPVAANNGRRNVIRTGGGNEINIDDQEGSTRIKMTVPSNGFYPGGTIFQLGSPNAQESGAALETYGAFTQTVASGTGALTSAATSYSLLGTLRLGGDVVTAASKMTWFTSITTVAAMAEAVIKATSSVLSTFDNYLDWGEKAALERAYNEQTEEKKGLEALAEQCKDCQAKLKALTLPKDSSTALATKGYQEAANKYQEAAKATDSAFDDALKSRRTFDVKKDATLGYYTTPHGLAHVAELEAATADYNEKLRLLDEAAKQQAALLKEVEQLRPPTSVGRDIHEHLDSLIKCHEECSEKVKKLKLLDKGAIAAYRTLKSDNDNRRKQLKFGIGLLNMGSGVAGGVAAATTAIGSVVNNVFNLVSTETAKAALENRHTRLKSTLDASKPIGAPIKRVNPASPMHSLGAAHSTELYGKESTLVWGKHVGIFGTVDPDLKSAALTAAGGSELGKVHIAAPEEVLIGSPTIVRAASDKEVSLNAPKLHLTAGAKNPSEGSGDPPTLRLIDDKKNTFEVATHDWNLRMDNERFCVSHDARKELVELTQKELKATAEHVKIDAAKGWLTTRSEKSTHVESGDLVVVDAKSGIHLNSKSGVHLDSKGSTFIEAKGEVYANGTRISLG